jgi:hypothetical protein
MKSKILIILLILIIGCKREENKVNVNKNRGLEGKTKPYFIDEQSHDTIKPQSFYLKNNYKLIIFPAQVENKNVVNFRLIKGQSDNTYLLSDTFRLNYIKEYNNVDFKDYFALHSNGGGTSNLYFWLFEKETGKVCLTGIQQDFDLKNELILYVDEDNEYKIFIYDVNSKAKTLVDIPKSFRDKHICMQYNDYEKYLFIKNVTKKYYFLAFKNCPTSIIYKIKK